MRRSVECAMSIMAVCTKAQSHHDHGRAGGLHLAFIFVCMSDDCASQNQRMINAVTWAELKYQSLSRVEDSNFSTKSHWPWITGPDQSCAFFQSTFQGVYYAKRSILRIVGADFSWCVWGCPAGSRSWGGPSTRCREDVTHLALE